MAPNLRRPPYAKRGLFYSTVEEVDGDEQDLLKVQLDLEAREERDHYAHQTSELQGLLKSCALELVEHEMRLIECTQADDVAAELDDLRSQIKRVTTDQEQEAKETEAKRLQKMLSFWTLKQSIEEKRKDDLTPEEAIDMALTSLKASIEYFQDERGILTSRIDTLKERTKTQKTKFMSTLKEMQQRVASLESERDLLSEKCQYHRNEFESALLKMGDQMQSLAGERDELSHKCHTLAEDLAYTQKQQELKEELRGKEDKEIISTMRMMHDYIYELDTEQAMLAEQCESQVSTIARMKKENELKESDEEKKEEQEEINAHLIDLKAQHEKLTSKYSFRENTITAIELENASLKSRIEALEEDKERLDNKLQLQDEAVAFVCGEDSQFKSQILNLQEERDQLYRNCKSQEDKIVLLKGESEKANALEDMASRMEEMKNEYKRLLASCTSQESTIVTLEKENKLLNDGQRKGEKQVDSTLVHLKAKIEDLEEELDKRRTQCQSQEAAIVLLKQEKQVNVSLEEEQAKKGEQSVMEMKAYIQELESERDQFDSKCKSQQEAIAIFQQQSNLHFIDADEDEGEENKEETEYTSEEMKKYMAELEFVKQKIASRSCRRESAIAVLEEQNDFKDARLEILEGMVRSLMAARGISPRATRWREQLDKLPWRKRESVSINLDQQAVPTMEDALAFLHETPQKQEVFSHSASHPDNLSIISQ
jgi:chromosome segregation ATPase